MREKAISPTTQTSESIRADFDRIALLEGGCWDHNAHYHEYLMRHLPRKCGRVLEIGCGAGSFSRRLARRAERVTAIDLSPQMIRLARERAKEFPNIDFVNADAMTYSCAAHQFDAVATLTTLHHLPMEDILRKISRALRPGGVFLCLDLYRRSSLSDALLDGAAFPASLLLNLIKNGSLRPPKEIREAYAEHGKTDAYLTLPEIERICARRLAGAQIKRHLFWRYSIVWKKESSGDS
jgi:ubiquinone/menaquinone biosynthesis C-methylase UbiE